MSIIANVADAVKAELNGHTFSMSFTAERTYLPNYKRAKTSSLKVWVVPAIKVTEQKSHAARGQQVQIDVGVGAPVNPELNEEVDPYVDLLEELDNFLAMRALTAYPNAKWTESETLTGSEGGYSPEMLDKNDMYLGLVRITYRIC